MKTRLSKVVEGGLDINSSGFTENPSGGMNAGVYHWQMALLYAILQELKTLNATLGCYRVRQMADDVHKIDKRMAHVGRTAHLDQTAQGAEVTHADPS